MNSDDPPLLTVLSDEDPAFARAAIAVVTANVERLRMLLAEHPELVHERARAEHGATLLHYTSANAIDDELQLSPDSIYNVLQNCGPEARPAAEARAIETVQTLLDAGAHVDALATAYGGGNQQTTLNWMVSSAHPAAAGVMTQLVETLCRAGAKVDGLNDDSSPIFTALGFGYPEAADVLFARGCRRDNLLLAAAAGDLDAVQACYQRGTWQPGDVARCAQEWFPVPQKPEQIAELALVLASMCGRVDVARFLIEAGVDKNALPSGTHVMAGPLHTAAMCGQAEIVDLLIELGSDPTLVEPRYQGRPLDWARRGGHLPVIQKVGQYAPDYQRRTIGTGPEMESFIQAVFAADVPALRDLLRRHEFSIEQLNGPWFHFDAPAVVQAKSNLPIIDCLLEAGADINQRSHWWAGGFGVLHETKPDLAEELIARGAQLDVWSAAQLERQDELEALVRADPPRVRARGPDGKTALHCAGNVPIAEWLLDQGADLDARCLDHHSTAAQYLVVDQPDVARCLVERGCATDMMLAAALGDLSLAQAILQKNPQAVRTIVDRQHFPSPAADHIYSWKLGWYSTAHQIADRFGHTDLVEALLEHSPAPTRLLNACLLGHSDRIRAMIADDPKLAAQLTDVEHQHVAHAARNNQTEQVATLLEYGFAVTAVGQHGANCLHWAAFHGNAEMVALILPYHPPLEAQDDDFGSTAVGWARHGCQHGWHRDGGDYVRTLQSLLAAGYQPPAKINPTGIADVDKLFA